MYKKIIAILMFVVIPMLSNAQHLEFFGIQMNGSISNFEKILIDKGVERDYVYIKSNDYIMKERDRIWANYKVNHDNHEYKIWVFSTYYSDIVYSVWVNFSCENQDSLQSIYYRIVGELVTKYNLKKKDGKQVVYSNDFGEVSVSLYEKSLQIAFRDYENDALRKAEDTWLGYDKKMCKRLQKKYNNPLFYDENPRFKN